MLAQVEVLDDHEGLELEHQSMELCNSYLVSDLPINGGCRYLVAENAIRNVSSQGLGFHVLNFDKRNRTKLMFCSYLCMIKNPSVTEIPIEQEAPQDQSGSNEQGRNVGNPVPADERSNQHNSTVDNDGYSIPSNPKTTLLKTQFKW
ncbi:hypothetical protein V6N13_087071 [Hibiscus sabdariffa]